MKTKTLAAAILTVAWLVPAAARAAKLRVVATIPDLADITREIGGDRVDVTAVLAHGTEDIHQVTMRPSFVPALHRADAVVELGMTVEHAFLPGLLEVAANPNISSDPRGCLGPGCIDCSQGLHVLGKPKTLSRAEGELHPQGNPHYNMGPQDGVVIARNIAAGLSRLDPGGAAVFQKNLDAYLAKLDAKLAEWKKWVAPLKGVKAISFHEDIDYLEAFTGLDFVGTVEVKPGVAPTPSHLVELVNKMKEQKVTLLVREQQYDPKQAQWLADQTGAKVAVIGQMTNSFPDADTFIKYSEHNLKAILTAAGQEPK